MTTWNIAKAHPFFDVAWSIVDHEIRPGRTITFLAEVDLTEVEALRAKSAADKPSYTSFVVKAVALALREFPYANRRVFRRWWLPLSAVRTQTFASCDVAVACERDIAGAETASFADVLRDADRRSLSEITSWLRALSRCDASDNKQWREFNAIIERLPRPLAALLIRLPVLFPSLWAKYRGGAAWVSSPAKYGVDGVVGSWPSPLGVSFGLAKPRPIARDGRAEVRPTFHLTLNWDRRVMAGAQAARFFKRIVEILEHAESEMEPYLSCGLRQSGERREAGREVAPAV